VGVPLVLYISGLALVVGGVTVLVLQSFQDALKGEEEEEEEEEGARGEGRESFVEKQIGRLSSKRGSRASSAYASLGDGPMDEGGIGGCANGDVAREQGGMVQ